MAVVPGSAGNVSDSIPQRDTELFHTSSSTYCYIGLGFEPLSTLFVEELDTG